MSRDGHAVVFRAMANESPPDLGERLRSITSELVSQVEASSAALFVADGHPETLVQPVLESPVPASFDAMLLVTGVPIDSLPKGDATFHVHTRMIKPKPRGADGERSPGFTLVVPIVRAPELSHEQFDEHWHDRHAPLHVRNSPGTMRYEQLLIDPAQPLTRPWDGITLLGFASPRTFPEDMFADADAGQALLDDAATFTDATRTEALLVSEYTYRDGS